MLNFGWWRDRDNREGAVALSNILKVLVPALILAGGAVAGYFYTQDATPPLNPGPSINATGGSQVQTGDGTQVSTGDNSPVMIGGDPSSNAPAK